MGVAPVPAGDAFSERQQDDVVRAIRLARKQSQLPVSVYVGTLEGDSRAMALQLHHALGADAERAVRESAGSAGEGGGASARW